MISVLEAKLRKLMLITDFLFPFGCAALSLKHGEFFDNENVQHCLDPGFDQPSIIQA